MWSRRPWLDPSARRAAPRGGGRRGVVEVDEGRDSGAGLAARGQDGSVGQNGRVELAAPRVEGSARRDSRYRPGIGVENDRGSPRAVGQAAFVAVAAAGDEGLADVVGGKAAVVTHRAVPGAAAGDGAVA